MTGLRSGGNGEDLVLEAHPLSKKTWITDDNAPQPRQDYDYIYDENMRIDGHSIGMESVFTRVPFNDDTTP